MKISLFCPTHYLRGVGELEVHHVSYTKWVHYGGQMMACLKVYTEDNPFFPHWLKDFPFGSVYLAGEEPC